MSDKEPLRCPCHELQDLMELTEQHTQLLKTHEERLARGNVDFAVISTKLNIIMAILSAVGIAVCGAIITIIL